MAQLPVAIQKILGAFNPTTNQIVGVCISGETPYQNIPNSLIATTFPNVRTATSAATNTIFALGKVTQGDGSGNTFVFNPSDLTSGCVCFGTAAGTVLTVSSVSSGALAVGLTLATAATGIPLATITSFGTGAGGTGTYNLSAPVNIVPLTQFVLDNNSTILVSGDGSRWYLNTTTTTFTNFNAPSGNPAIQLTTPAYTFGNTTDNPTYSFVGTGRTTMNGGLTLNPSTGLATQITNVSGSVNIGTLIPATSIAGNMVVFQATNSSAAAGATCQWYTVVTDTCTFSNYSSANTGVMTNDFTGQRAALYMSGASALVLGTNFTPRLALTAAGSALIGNATIIGDPGAGNANAQGAYYVQGMPQCVSTANNAPAVITTVETYIVNPYTIPANAVAVGNQFRIHIYGQCTSSVAANITTITVRFGPAGTVADTALASPFTLASASSGTNIGFYIELLCSFTTVGASAVLWDSFTFLNNGVTGVSTTAQLTFINTSTTVNSTVLNKLGVSLKTSAATTGVQIFFATIERLF